MGNKKKYFNKNRNLPEKMQTTKVLSLLLIVCLSLAQCQKTELTDIMSCVSKVLSLGEAVTNSLQNITKNKEVMADDAEQLQNAVHEAAHECVNFETPLLSNECLEGAQALEESLFKLKDDLNTQNIFNLMGDIQKLMNEKTQLQNTCTGTGNF